MHEGAPLAHRRALGRAPTSLDRATHAVLTEFIPRSCFHSFIIELKRMICLVCLASDGVNSSDTIQKSLDHPAHAKALTRVVCARCWQFGRSTPVTCRTFGHDPEREGVAQPSRAATKIDRRQANAVERPRLGFLALQQGALHPSA